MYMVVVILCHLTVNVFGCVSVMGSCLESHVFEPLSLGSHLPRISLYQPHYAVLFCLYLFPCFPSNCLQVDLWRYHSQVWPVD